MAFVVFNSPSCIRRNRKLIARVEVNGYSYICTMPRQLISNHRLFLSIFALYVLLGAIGFIYYQQGNEIVFLNNHHSSALDFFFSFITQLAEGWSLTLIGIALLLWRVKYALLYLIDIIVLSFVVQFLKHQVFPDRLRPSLFFGAQYPLHFVTGVPVFTHYSFPSGHTALAFGVFFLVAIVVKRTSASMLFLVLAFGVGLSRMYLLQHFWIDVYFGSILGIFTTLVIYILFQNVLIHTDRRWLNLSAYDYLLTRKNL